MEGKLGEQSSSADLLKWVVAVAFGKSVNVKQGLGSALRVRMQAALGHEHHVRFTSAFITAHPDLWKITTEIAKDKGSKWCYSLLEKGPKQQNAFEIRSCSSFGRWLHSIVSEHLDGG